MRLVTSSLTNQNPGAYGRSIESQRTIASHHQVPSWMVRRRLSYFWCLFPPFDLAQNIARLISHRIAPVHRGAPPTALTIGLSGPTHGAIVKEAPEEDGAISC